MYKNFKLYFVIGLAVLAVFLNSLVIFANFNLDEIQSLFSIIGSASVGLALMVYVETKDREVTTAAIDLVSLFRKEIILETDQFIIEVKSRFPKYSFPRVRLTDSNMQTARINYSAELTEQENLCKNQDLFSKQTVILNLLEEVSLRITNFGAINHPALNSIRATFIQTVETSAWVLLRQKEIYAGYPMFETILEIYRRWGDSARMEILTKK